MKKSEPKHRPIHGTVVAFERQFCTGTVVYDLTPLQFHSTSYHGINNGWPRVGARVELVFNDRGDLLSLHEVKA